MHVCLLITPLLFFNCAVLVMNMKLLKYSVRQTRSGCPCIWMGVNLHKKSTPTEKNNTSYLSMTIRGFVLQGRQVHWTQQRCWVPAVFQINSYLLWRWVESRSKTPQTQFLPLFFLWAGRPPDQLCGLSRQVHASHAWTLAQAEPWEGQYLPRCTVAEHHVQSMSSSCCSTVQVVNNIVRKTQFSEKDNTR